VDYQLYPGFFVTGSSGYDFPYTFSGMQYRSPPKNTSEADLISGTLSWPAKEGCYTVMPFIGPNNPPQTVSYVQPIIDFDVHDDEINNGYGSDPFINQNSILIPAIPTQETNIPYLPANKMFPIHTAGSIFAGLSPETTLTVRVNYYVETFPGMAELNDLTLATPSAPYDPLALKIFSEVMGNMAVSTMLKNNPMGEYFAEVVKTIADFAAPILDIAGIPWGGMAARGVSKIASHYMAPPNSNYRSNKKDQNRLKMLPPSSGRETKQQQQARLKAASDAKKIQVMGKRLNTATAQNARLLKALPPPPKHKATIQPPKAKGPMKR